MSLATYCIIIGIYELVVGLPMIARPAAMALWLEEATKNVTLIRVLCLLFLVLSVLVLVEDASGNTGAATFVRLIAWITAIKCVPGCWWPQHIVRLGTWWMPSASAVRFFGVAATALGIWLLSVSASI